VPAAHAQEDEYRALITDAVAEFDAHRFEESRALFRRAHEMSPNARTLRGIGLASFEVRDYPEAYRALSAALVDERRALAPEQVTEVRALLERTRGFLGIYRIPSPPPGMTLRLDGVQVELESDGRLIVPLGAHTVSARAPGLRDASVAVHVNGGEDAELALELELASDPQPGQDLGGPGEAGARGPAAPPDPTAGVVLLVVGGAVAVASLGTAGWWRFHDEQVATCPMIECVNPGEVSTVRDAAAATTISLAIVGAGLLTAGAILLAMPASTDSHAVRCAPAGPGVACAGRF
jgi:hypothetical protein